MLYGSLAKRELDFRSSLIDSAGKKFKASSPTLGNTRLSHKNDNWYFKEKTDKTKIVLHFTMGNLPGDIGELTHHYVSVAYVVARDGQVYELFDPDYWSYHLGPSATGGNGIESKASIGIEVSNYGPLYLENGTLFTAYKSAYCSLQDTQAYVAIPRPGYRGYFYFASFTSEQYEALRVLMSGLIRRYSIQKKWAADPGVFFKSAPGPGIWTHQNYRRDKVDIGPAFDWSEIKDI